MTIHVYASSLAYQIGSAWRLGITFYLCDVRESVYMCRRVGPWAWVGADRQSGGVAWYASDCGGAVPSELLVLSI